jgi:hypothetical protein
MLLEVDRSVTESHEIRTKNTGYLLNAALIPEQSPIPVAGIL